MKERQEKIFSILVEKPKVTVKELSSLLRVSEVTIRKDLAQMDRDGVLKRMHGGAAQVSSDSIEKRMLIRYDDKLKIAREAVKLVEDGETVLIEAGSANSVFAKELAENREVNIITNSLHIARLVKGYGNVQVTVIGGNLQSEAEAMVGPLARLALSQICVRKAFIGVSGLSESLGFTCSDFLRAEIGREMSARAEQVIVLADSSKFENAGVTTIVELPRVNMVITDQGIPESKRNLLRKNNIHVIAV